MEVPLPPLTWCSSATKKTFQCLAVSFLLRHVRAGNALANKLCAHHRQRDPDACETQTILQSVREAASTRHLPKQHSSFRFVLGCLLRDFTGCCMGHASAQRLACKVAVAAPSSFEHLSHSSDLSAVGICEVKSLAILFQESSP